MTYSSSPCDPGHNTVSAGRQQQRGGSNAPDPDPLLIHPLPLRILPDRENDVLPLLLPQPVPHDRPKPSTSRTRTARVDDEDDVGEGRGEVVVPVEVEFGVHHLRPGSTVSALGADEHATAPSWGRRLTLGRGQGTLFGR